MQNQNCIQAGSNSFETQSHQGTHITNRFRDLQTSLCSTAKTFTVVPRNQYFRNLHGDNCHGNSTMPSMGNTVILIPLMCSKCPFSILAMCQKKEKISRVGLDFQLLAECSDVDRCFFLLERNVNQSRKSELIKIELFSK